MGTTVPGLRNEKLKGTDQQAFSTTMNYRATYIRSEKGITITAVGTHKEVLQPRQHHRRPPNDTYAVKTHFARFADSMTR